MDKARERSLMQGCRSGDRKALEKLVREYEQPVFSATCRMLGNADEAADVTQTAFVKVFENLEHYDPRFRLFSWIHRIAINEAIDRMRRRGRSESLQQLPPSPDGNPSQSAAAAELGGEVQRTLLELNEDLRTVLVLRYFSDLSYHEIGEVLRLPDRTVKSRLFAARRQMKKRLIRRGILEA